VLDEPTNDLDMETIDLLQEVIADYDGTILIVSHDRDFLDRTVTSVLAFEGEGKITPHAGGYSDYLGRRTKQADRAKEKAKAKKVAKDKPKAPRTDRLTFKDAHALKTLPAEISRLQDAISAAEDKLADMTFFQSEPEAYQACAAQCEADKVALSEAEDQWLTLEMKREEIEGQD